MKQCENSLLCGEKTCLKKATMLFTKQAANNTCSRLSNDVLCILAAQGAAKLWGYQSLKSEKKLELQA